jgi:hypothetical protein
MLKNNKKELKVISIRELMLIFAIPKNCKRSQTEQRHIIPLYGGGSGNALTATYNAEDT